MNLKKQILNVSVRIYDVMNWRIKNSGFYVKKLHDPSCGAVSRSRFYMWISCISTTALMTHVNYTVPRTSQHHLNSLCFLAPFPSLEADFRLVPVKSLNVTPSKALTNAHWWHGVCLCISVRVGHQAAGGGRNDAKDQERSSTSTCRPITEQTQETGNVTNML